MGTQHYSLRWNNHQTHVLHAFDTLLQNETLVDVTLVCEETRVRAHKVVLSACSPFFQRIFSENPCKHPVIILKDLRRWEVQGIVDFMYKGEISVAQEHLTSLIKAAESLQVRGLAHTEDKDPATSAQPVASQTVDSSASFESPPCPPPTEEGEGGRNEGDPKTLSPFCTSPLVALEPPRLSHQQHEERGDSPSPIRPSPLALTPYPPIGGHPSERSSPLPRRKQARPRRRSGELLPQDLSKPGAQPSLETPENLSMKKASPSRNVSRGDYGVRVYPSDAKEPRLSEKTTKCEQQEEKAKSVPTEFAAPPVPPALIDGGVDKPPLVMATDRGDYSNCTDSLGLPPLPSMDIVSPPYLNPNSKKKRCLSSINLDSSLESTPFPQLPSVSSLSLTPPQAFNTDSQHIGFFAAMDACQNPLLNEILPETRIENHILGKRKLGRPKGQHSAPRGGPPRSWTNSELTEALHNVWNKRMTTSQASRIFGIPYNSLLMYVRGKYGKSLKLEQLKKNCLVGGGRGGPLQGELLPPVLGVGRGPYLAEGEEGGGSSRDMETTLPLDPYAQLYSEFGSFPIPVGMIHLLPQSEKNREFPAEMEKREKKKSGKRRERREERREARLGEEKMADEGDGRGGKEVEEVVMKMKEDYQNREGVRGANLCDGAEVVGHDNERRPDPMVCD